MMVIFEIGSYWLSLPSKRLQIMIPPQLIFQLTPIDSFNQMYLCPFCFLSMIFAFKSIAVIRKFCGSRLRLIAVLKIFPYFDSVLLKVFENMIVSIVSNQSKSRHYLFSIIICKFRVFESQAAYRFILMSKKVCQISFFSEFVLSENNSNSLQHPIIQIQMLMDKNEEKRFQLGLQISNKKCLILRIHNTIPGRLDQSLKIKYFAIRSQIQKVFILHSLSKIYSCKKLKKFFVSQLYGLVAQNPNYAYAIDYYFDGQDFSHYLLSGSLERGDEHHHNEIKKLFRFKLLDCFVHLLPNDKIIVNYQNLYLLQSEIFINQISFVGMDLIFFDKEISSQQFKSIFNFLDSEILDRKPCKRIGHRQKIKNFGALLLTFAIQMPIRLLQNQQLPDFVSFELARQKLHQSKNLYGKFLKIKGIQRIIKAKQILWKVELNKLLTEILIEEKNKSWNDIYTYFIQTDGSKNLKQLMEVAVNKYWSSLSKKQKDKICQFGLINEQQALYQLSIDSSLFLLVIGMGLPFSALKNGSIIEEMSDSRNLDRLTMEMMTSLLNLLLMDSPRQQGLQIHVKDLHYRGQMTGIMQEKRECKKFQEETIKCIYPTSSQTFQNTPLNLSQSSQNHLREQQKHEKPFQSIDQAIKLMKSKMSTSFQIEGKIIKIEHQRLKGLRQFESAFH